VNVSARPLASVAKRGPSRLAPLMASLALACGGGDPPPAPRLRPSVISVEVANPAVEGTTLQVTVADLDAAGEVPTLEVDGVTLRASEDGGVLRAPLSGMLVTRLGVGTHAVEVIVAGSRASSDPSPFSLTIADGIDVSLDAAPGGVVRRNELAVLGGAGFLEATEGSLTARFVGTFTPDEGSAADVDASLPVTQAELGARDRGLVALTTAIGGPLPGVFEGTMALTSTLVGGGASRVDPVPVTLEFEPPAIFELRPSEAALEQIVVARGGGFLGAGLGGPDEVTLIRLDGRFVPDEGAPRDVSDVEVVPAFFSGTEVGFALASRVEGDVLVTELGGVRRGRFEGTLTPIAIAGTTEVEGDPAPVTLAIEGVRQVVLLRFLPGFYGSLTRFGLAAAAGTIEPLVEERIETIYGRWNVDVRLEEPTDVTAAGLSIVEINGPDPNGRGLFGYDNSPGKDQNNLRLRDAIGGGNWETQEDGYPGFGGVFVESFLSFSTHPELEMGAGPEPDLLFDEIFDGVRAEPATLAEVRGLGERAPEVDRAVRALAAMIGETTAHEIGHSLGMADPFGGPTTFHNASNGDGCLMDSGASRPLGERAAQPGFAETHLCGDNAIYLDEVLPR